MGVYVENVTFPISLALTTLRLTGFWAPDDLSGIKKVLYNCYAFFSFICYTGIFIIIQVILIAKIWGDLPQMTGIAFLLFTNTAQMVKIGNIVFRKSRIQHIIDGCNETLKDVHSKEGTEIIKGSNQEVKLSLTLFLSLSFVTLIGWLASPEVKDKQLPLPGWYPYNISKSPAYEVSYIHQIIAVFGTAFLNINKDMLVCAVIAQCRCRLKLLGMSLKTLCLNMQPFECTLTLNQEEIIRNRLYGCVREHQAVLEAAVQLQNCFSEPIFGQLIVSLIIICVTAYQLVSQTGNLIRFLGMSAYLLAMMFQMFIYCYHGHQLSYESLEVAGAVYECPWYACSARLRRDMLIVMARTRRVVRITAGGFTILSLDSFTSILKASYSLFTVLQQVTD